MELRYGVFRLALTLSLLPDPFILSVGYTVLVGPGIDFPKLVIYLFLSQRLFLESAGKHVCVCFIYLYIYLSPRISQ